VSVGFTPMLWSIFWIICINVSITIISVRGILECRYVFIVKGESVFLENGGNRLSDHGSPFSEHGQSRGLKRGSSCLPGTWLPRVRWACLFVYKSCASTFRGMLDRDVGCNVFETRSGYLGFLVFSWRVMRWITRPSPWARQWARLMGPINGLLWNCD